MNMNGAGKSQVLFFRPENKSSLKLERSGWEIGDFRAEVEESAGTRNSSSRIYTNTKYDAISTLSLLSISGREPRAELQSRLLLPVATILLGFIAFPVSYSSPRKGKYAKVFLGSLIYFSYLIMMSVIEKLYLLETTPSILGMWWIHFLMLLMIVFIYKNDMKSIPSRT